MGDSLTLGSYLWLTGATIIVGLFFYRAGRIWLDAGRRRLGTGPRLLWALQGAVRPARYWWQARIEVMLPEERQQLLIQETKALGLERADSLRCPLCAAEVPSAWTLTIDGLPTTAAGPVECPECDFRLDACRHCSHFLPGSPKDGTGWGGADITFGRCDVYRTSQSVDQACAPDIARQLRRRGIECIRAPMAIVDSFLPPDSCRAFKSERSRLRSGNVNWPDARRVALLRLTGTTVQPDVRPHAGAPSGNEEWLL
jgi:hypothetical protein